MAKIQSKVKQDTTRRELPLRKKIIFSGVVVFVVFACLELGLRAARIGEAPVVGVLRFGYETGIPVFDSDGIEREGEPYRDVPLFEADPVLFWKPIANTPFTGTAGLRLPAPETKMKERGRLSNWGHRRFLQFSRCESLSKPICGIGQRRRRAAKWKW